MCPEICESSPRKAAPGGDAIVRGCFRHGATGVRGLTAQSFETGSRRIHVVSLDGDSYRAATPLDGPRSRVVFDPARRAFAPLLPSIRVELDGDVRLDAVEAALAAVRMTVFESLGFAVVDLPADLHPAEAVQRVRALPGQPEAAVRLRRPGIEWK